MRREVRAVDVVLAELLSCRGPAAWLSLADEPVDGRTTLCQLSRDCSMLGQCLVISGSLVDLVLLPRCCSEAGERCCCLPPPAAHGQT